MTVTEGDLNNARDDFHSARYYMSIIKPLTLWEARVTNSAARGIYDITFNQGTGLDFTAVAPFQEVWIGTSQGGKEVGVVRIRGISSGDSGVTGTVNVNWQGYAFGPGAYLTFIHNYPLAAKYPWLGLDDVLGTNEVFYKDVFTAYTDQNAANKIKPVGVIDFSSRAGFIRGGELVYWVDASNSYTMAPGATITSYALTCYPTSGVTINFNTSTGKGYVIVTSLTQEYYWLKFVITDSNGISRTTYRAVFAHNPDPTGDTYPIVDFDIGAYGWDWDNGGVSAKVTFERDLSDILSGDRQAIDMTDEAFAMIWRERTVGASLLGQDHVVTVRSSTVLFIDPVMDLSSSRSATCDVRSTFKAGIRIDGEIPPNGTIIDMDFQVGSNPPASTYGYVTDGILTTYEMYLNVTLGDCDETVYWKYGSDTIASRQLYPGIGEVRSTIYPSKFLCFPSPLLTGYLREDTDDEDESAGTGQLEYVVESPESILKNHFMFSIGLDAKQSPSDWYEYHRYMTTAKAAYHVLDEHSFLLDVCDVLDLDADEDLRPFATFSGGTLYTMPDDILRSYGIRAHLVSNRQGQIKMCYDIQLLTDEERDVIPVAWKVEKQDRGGNIQIQEREFNAVALVYGDGVYWDGTFDGSGNVDKDRIGAYCALAPWYVPHWSGGSDTVQLSKQTVRSQLHLNEITGRRYAQVNNPFPEFNFEFKGDYLDILSVGTEEFWKIDVFPYDNIKGLTFINQKLILRNIDCDIDVGAGTITVNTGWEPEVESLDAVTAVCPEIDISLDGIPPIDWEEPYLPGTIVTSS